MFVFPFDSLFIRRSRVMLRFGFAFVLANIFIHSATTGELALSSKTHSSGKESISVEKAREFQFFPFANESSKTIKKCCPWGTSFDANSLICKSSPENLFPVNRELYSFSFGVPQCIDTVLYSVGVRSFDAEELRVNGESFPEDYCIDGDDAGTIAVACGDSLEVCRNRPCFRKCKPLGEFYESDENGTKTAEESSFSPVFYNLTTLTPDESVTVFRFGLFFDMKCEEGKIRLDNGTSDVNYLLTNGSLYAPGQRQSQVFQQHEFCLEHVQGEGIFAFLCLQAEKKEAEDTENHILLGLGFIASCVCLLATFFVYLCSRKSKSLYGKTLMFYVGCLCIAYLSLAVVHLGNSLFNKGACVALGYSILLSFLAAFFWLNIMSIDIWKTFRSLRATEWRKTPSSRSRLTAYSIYAWGTPLALTFVCGMLDALPRTGATSAVDMFRPNIGLASCWFSRTTYGMYVFFVAPVSLIIACNVFLYVNTAWRCWKVKAEINRLGLQSGRSGGKYSVHREQLLLNGKLFIVMGVSWGPEFISTMLPHPLWKVTDAMNTLLGVFIFVIFVLKKKVISSMTQRVRDSLRSLSKREHQLDYFKKEASGSLAEKNAHTTTTNM